MAVLQEGVSQHIPQCQKQTKNHHQLSQHSTSLWVQVSHLFWWPWSFLLPLIQFPLFPQHIIPWWIPFTMGSDQGTISTFISLWNLLTQLGPLPSPTLPHYSNTTRASRIEEYRELTSILPLKLSTGNEKLWNREWQFWNTAPSTHIYEPNPINTVFDVPGSILITVLSHTFKWMEWTWRTLLCSQESLYVFSNSISGSYISFSPGLTALKGLLLFRNKSKIMPTCDRLLKSSQTQFSWPALVTDKDRKLT